MMTKNRRKRREAFEEHSYWQSYSDMMAALLLIFVLIIAITLAIYRQKTVDLEQSQNSLGVARQELEDAKKDLEDARADLEEYRAAIEKSNQELAKSLAELQQAYADAALTQDELNKAYLENYGMECCECGCCSYVCPAKRPLTQEIKSMRKIQLAKRKK